MAQRFSEDGLFSADTYHNKERESGVLLFLDDGNFFILESIPFALLHSAA